MKRSLAILSLLVARAILAQPHKLTINEIYDPANSNAFSATPQKGFVWVDDDHFFWPRRNAAGDVVADVLEDVRSGREVAMFDSADLQTQVRRIEGVSDEDARQLSHPASPELHPKTNALVVTAGGDLYVYSIVDKTLTRLTSQSGAEEQATFSPDGRMVSFVRGNDLFVSTLPERRSGGSRPGAATACSSVQTCPIFLCR